MNASPACLIAFLCRIIYNKVLTKDDLQLAEGEGPSMETPAAFFTKKGGGRLPWTT